MQEMHKMQEVFRKTMRQLKTMQVCLILMPVQLRRQKAQSSSEETETFKEAKAGSESSEDSEAFETVDSDKTDQVVIERLASAFL